MLVKKISMHLLNSVIYVYTVADLPQIKLSLLISDLLPMSIAVEKRQGISFIPFRYSLTMFL